VLFGRLQRSEAGRCGTQFSTMTNEECEERLAFIREDVELLREKLRKAEEFIAAIEILSKDMNGET
jgi:hypothetical protein